MYARFYRWATDRINGNGIVAFITNRSFIDSRTFDGFRKSISQEFDYAYIVDLQGDIRGNNKQANENIFNIMTGVAIAFFIRKEKADTKFIKYYSVNFEKAKEKLEFLQATPLRAIPFDNIQADKNNNWINIAVNDFNSLKPLIDKQNKLGKTIKNKEVLFYKYSNGISTNRDEWVYDFDIKNLEKKSKFFIDEYNSEVERWIQFKKETNYIDIKAESNPVVDKFLHDRNLIKWSKMIKRDKFRKGKKGVFKKTDITKCIYRPYTLKYLYNSYISIDLVGQFSDFFPKKDTENKIIVLRSTSPLRDFSVIAVSTIFDLHAGDGNSGFIGIGLYIYDNKNNKIENLTDWGLKQFTEHYKDETITKEDVFYYTYAVFHNPEYIKKYELNLKREFPRIPFYLDFWKWSKWGKELMDLHIDYESAEQYELKILEEDKPKEKPKPKLKAIPENGEIVLDENTSIAGIPKTAWEYKFGNRSALHWIVDQYKEKTIDDKTLSEMFKTYKFADYKQIVIELIKKITTISVKTMEIVNQMKETKG